MSSISTLKRDDFETAVVLARRVLFEGAPVAEIAAERGVQPWKVAAEAIQPLIDVMINIAKAANSPSEIVAAIDALKTFADEDD